MTTLPQVFEIYHGRINRISQLMDDGYLDESVILIVTIFEVLLENVFKMNSKYWFYERASQFPVFSQFSNLSTEEKVKYRMKIEKYLKKIHKYNEYIENFCIYYDIKANPEICSLYGTLFNRNNKKSVINFQNLTEDYGARRAYLIFFNIDISKSLDHDPKKSDEKWKLLCKLVRERHDIIHKGTKTTFTKMEILEVLGSIDYLKDHILINLSSCFFNEFHKQVLDEISKN